jgi:hypothetical protein
MIMIEESLFDSEPRFLVAGKIPQLGVTVRGVGSDELTVHNARS